jgi:hypothetical protein
VRDAGGRRQARAMIAVIEVFGALNFEMFGQLNNTIDERGAWFDLQARTMASFIGLPGASPGGPKPPK